ncbi:hypothetical protein EON65_51005 [archaeon]|nr:MAG: hypothetical protein EON65_51005 [archaeon]
MKVSQRGQDATDIDVYGIRFSAPFVYHDVICDCKDTRNVKSTERLFWARGLADFLKTDGVYVALATTSTDLVNFAKQGNVKVLSRSSIQEMAMAPNSDFRMSSGLANGLRYHEVEQRIRSVGRLDRYARELFDYIKGLLLIKNPYVALNQCIDVTSYTAERVRMSDAFPSPLPEIWRYLLSDAVSVFSVLLLKVAADVANLSRKDRAAHIVQALSYGDIPPDVVHELFHMAGVLATNAARQHGAQTSLSFMSDTLPPPPYADSVAGLVERTLENPRLYTGLPNLMDHLMFEHSFPYGAFKQDVFRQHYPKLEDEHLKVARNILAFLRDAASLRMSDLFSQANSQMPRLNGEQIGDSLPGL